LEIFRKSKLQKFKEALNENSKPKNRKLQEGIKIAMKIVRQETTFEVEQNKLRKRMQNSRRRVASDSESEDSESQQKPPRRIKERSRSKEKLARVRGQISKRKNADTSNKLSDKEKSHRRELPLKLKAKAVSKLESEIKELTGKVSKNISTMTSDLADDINSELIRFKLSIQHFNKEAKLFFNSSIGKHLNSLFCILEQSETASKIDLSNLKASLKELMKHSVRVITNGFFDETDIVHTYVCDSGDDNDQEESVDTSQKEFKLKKTRKADEYKVRLPSSRMKLMSKYSIQTRKEKKREGSFALQSQDNEGIERESPFSKRRKDKGTTRSGKLIAGENTPPPRLTKPVRHESENYEKASRRHKMDSPDLLPQQFREDIMVSQTMAIQNDDIKLREELPEELKQTSKKVLKKIAKELERLHSFSKLKSQDLALRLEGEILKRLLAVDSIKSDEEQLLSTYKSEIVILIKNLNDKVADLACDPEKRDFRLEQSKGGLSHLEKANSDGGY